MNFHIVSKVYNKFLQICNAYLYSNQGIFVTFGINVKFSFGFPSILFFEEREENTSNVKLLMMNINLTNILYIREPDWKMLSLTILIEASS